MANVLVNDASLADIADAIREKNGTEETYKPAEMGAAVRAIESGGGVGIILSDFTGNYNLPTIANVLSFPPIENNAYFNYSDNRFANLFTNNSANPNGGMFPQLQEVYLPELYGFSANMFSYCGKLTTIHGDFTRTERIGVNAFMKCTSLTDIPYMPNLVIIGNSAFSGCTGLTSINIYKTLTTCSTNSFVNCTNLLDIYVPWAEGEVANAPWGATNATIHYNTVYDENHEPVV